MSTGRDVFRAFLPGEKRGKNGQGLLFGPEEVAVAEVVDFTGEGGLVRATGVFEDPVNGEGSLKIAPFFLDFGGFRSGTGEPEVFRLGGVGVGAETPVEDVEVSLQGLILAAELFEGSSPDETGLIFVGGIGGRALQQGFRGEHRPFQASPVGVAEGKFAGEAAFADFHPGALVRCTVGEQGVGNEQAAGIVPGGATGVDFGEAGIGPQG